MYIYYIKIYHYEELIERDDPRGLNSTHKSHK